MPRFHKEVFRRITEAVSRKRFRMGLESYVPNNIQIYDAAFNGFIAGVYFGQGVGQNAESEFPAITDEAVIFAQAVDGQIDYSPSTDTAQATFIAQLSQSVTFNKWTTLTTADYIEAAKGIADFFTVAKANALIPVPGGGGSTPVPPTIVVAPAYQYATGVNSGNVYFNTVANAIVATADPEPVFGQLMTLGDSGLATDVNSLTLEPNGIEYEYPPGTMNSGATPLVFSATSPFGPSSGIVITWQYLDGANVGIVGGYWKCLG